MALSYCKALYSSSKMAWLMYFVGFLYLVISSFILIEKWSLPCSQTSRLLQDGLCANQSGVSQFYSIFTDTDLRQSPFYHLPFLSVLGKLLAPSSGLTLLEKVLTSHVLCPWAALPAASAWNHTPGNTWTPDSCCHQIARAMLECAPNQSQWELDLSWISPIPIPDKWLLCSPVLQAAPYGLCGQTTPTQF